MKLANKYRFLILLLLPLLTFSYEWVSSDSIGVYMKNYGEIEVWGPVIPGDTTKQIDRITLLVGESTTSVFDYLEDADVDEPAYLVESPTLSDMEGFTSINNFYSLAPPDIHAGITAYAWSGAEYIILHVVVTNIGTASISARIGFEIIPQIDGDYDGVNTWIPSGNFLDITREGSNHIGFKYLSHPMVSLSQFVWFSGYNGSDVDLFNWMNTDLFDTSAVCTNPEDGLVSIPATAPITMDPEVGIDFYYAFARGMTLEALETNMAAAQTAYNSIFTVAVDDEIAVPKTATLSPNFPNPFNPSTTINFSLTEPGQTTLNVYDLRGELVRSLRNEWLDSGSYSVDLDGAAMPSGIYVYRLTTGSTELTRKMTLLK